jgi:hypothetical protein
LHSNPRLRQVQGSMSPGVTRGYIVAARSSLKTKSNAGDATGVGGS